ncbi:retrotransposon protein, putative, ty1-copia subclass [Tanacetum coccineum]|uniref:Retrotransposon protein, putative, ty1-copia subclass n=1 Tax=Tanacetum coccineum TaxID=301880 RepID=A0ABQ5GVX9_9ASTR
MITINANNQRSTDLNETNLLGIAVKALPAAHETILPDNSMGMADDAQNTNNSTISSFGKAFDTFHLPVASQATRDAYDALFDAQNEVACIMLGSMSPDLHRALENYKAYDIIQERRWSVSKLLSLEDEKLIGHFGTPCMGKTITKLHAMLKLHEKGIPKKVETPVVLAIREGRIQKDNKKPQGAKGNDKGKNKLAYAPKLKIHYYQREIIRQRTLSTTTTSRGKRRLKHGALSLYVGNGMRAAVEAFVSFDLVLPSGLIIVLDNYMHNLYPNVSSIYNVSNKRAKHELDSSYLWHCRLGHINKKRMDKLQHDGILQPTHDESLEKCNHYGYVYLMKHKHEVFETFKVFQNEVENQFGKKIKAIQSDRGGKYFSHEFVNRMKSYGIISQLIPPYTPQHNGVSERRNQTLLNMVRSMMNLTTLPKSFWGYALESIARILNMVPTKKVDRTSYEIWHGYPKETMGYYFYYPLENKTFIAQNVEFFENSLTLQEASGSHGLLEASESNVGPELIQENDTQPSENTSKIHDEVEPNKHELGDLNEPPNYKAVLSDPESDKWLDVMNTKMQYMKDNQIVDPFNVASCDGCARNTIELLEGNNVVPLDPTPSDSLDLNDDNRERTCLRLFQFFLHNQASNWLERLSAGSISTWEDLTTRFLAQFFPPRRTAELFPHHGIDLWLQVQIFYDHVNPATRRTINQSAGGKLRDRNTKESWALLEDLDLYDNKSWNDPRDFAKPVKAISLPQDVLSTSDRRLIELENQVQRLMKAHLAPKQHVQVNKISSSCEICSGHHNTQYCMENPKQAFGEYASSRNNKVGGKQFTTNLGPRNFKEATNAWKDKPNFNWEQSQSFTSPQKGSFSTYSSSYQAELERTLSEFDSHQERRLSSLGAQLERQQDDMINKINILWKVFFEKLNDTSTRDTT